MLDTIKVYIKEVPDVPFDEFYQRYICYVQDINVQMEVKGIRTDEIVSLNKLLARLNCR